MYPTICGRSDRSRFRSVARHCVSMLKIGELAMLRVSQLRRAGHKRWCTAIVLLAVCTLTISVATRYSLSPGPTDQTRILIEKHHSVTPGLQRLLNNAATWIPPLAEAAIFYDPGQHPHIAPSDPPVSSVLLEKNLYNRPPPILPLAL
jgi:hypothetical protein